MVRFEKDKLVIEIVTKFPENDWLEHVRDLVWAIGAIDGELADQERMHGLCQLVLDMLPNEAEARRCARVAPEANGMTA